MANNQSHVADHKYYKVEMSKHLQSTKACWLSLTRFPVCKKRVPSKVPTWATSWKDHLGNKLVMVAGTKRKWNYQDLAVVAICRNTMIHANGSDTRAPQWRLNSWRRNSLFQNSSTSHTQTGPSQGSLLHKAWPSNWMMILSDLFHKTGQVWHNGK